MIQTAVRVLVGVVIFTLFDSVEISPVPSSPVVIVKDNEITSKLDKRIVEKIWSHPQRTEHVSLKSQSFLLDHLIDLIKANKIINSLKGKVTSVAACIACKLGVSILDHYVASGATEDDIGHLARSVCTKLHIESERVCYGVSQLFKEEVTVVLAQVALSPNEICGLLLGPTCAKDLNPLHNWTVPLTPFPKPPVKPIPPPKPGSPNLRVLHLSDTHLDPYYKEGSLANCNEPLCCREATGVVKFPGDAAGAWGDYRNCDTPLRTFENMLDHINKTHKIDFVIWTGDIPPHDIWNNSKKEVALLIHETSRLMKKYLGHVPIYPALGNHESFPVNSFPIPQIKGNESIAWLYDELVKTWGPWFSPDVSETLRRGAYYSVPVYPGFRIISVNMNYCNNMNWWLLINSTDPTGELQWLVNELQLAEIKGEKVHIIGHIPPGNFDCLRVWSHNYYEIMKRYESTVTAQFFGHTHTDEFEVFYDTDDYTPTSRAFSIAYVGPSITTYDGLNPGYRIYTLDGNYKDSSWVILDHDNYYMNLTEANIINKPIWRHEYSAREAFNMSSLLPADWDKLTKRAEHDNSLLQKLYRFYVKQSDFYPNPCSDTCKTALLCHLRKGCSDHGVCPPVQ